VVEDDLRVTDRVMVRVRDLVRDRDRYRVSVRVRDRNRRSEPNLLKTT